MSDSIHIINNDYQDNYAVPLDHPVTCLNPAPWKITEMNIEISKGNPKVWIRGQESMWFRADQCFCESLEECKTYIEIKKK